MLESLLMDIEYIKERNMTKVKICGLYRDDDIDYVNEVLPDYIGFVIYYPKSHRSIDLFEAKRLKEKLDSKIKAIGVFVNQHIELVKTAYRQGIIDIVQLQGDENEEYIRTLKDKLGITIIKSFSIKTELDIELANKSNADIVLLYTEPKEGEEYYKFILDKIKYIKKDYILAGGLNADNVGSIVKNLHPYCVDVSSGVETNKKKDLEKIRNFVKAVRG